MLQLEVRLLLVKGSVSEKVEAMCLQAGVVVMGAVPYRVLEQVSEALQVDMVGYVSLATQVQ